jgi:class 3 adenylate cyclase
MTSNKLEDVRLHPVTLRFPQPLEREFLDEYARRSVTYVRIVALLGLFEYAAFGLLDRYLFPELTMRLATVRFGIACPVLVAFILSTYWRGFARIMQPAIAAVGLVTGLGVVWMIAINPGSDAYYAGVLLVQLFLYTFFRLRFVWASLVCAIVLVGYDGVRLWVTPRSHVELASNTFFLLAGNLAGMFACWSIERYTRRDFLQRRAIAEEREKSERLLLNVLPPPIAERLKAGASTIADHFGEVTVLFADIVGFTTLSASISPDEVVKLLNRIFSRFDELAQRHGLEKIKTIGDAYMVVGGLPTERADHAGAVAEMALDMIEAMRGLHLETPGLPPVALRIGINTGPVVAGVIGQRKFIYDLWGDAVNVASRMEAHGVPGLIQLSDASAQLLRDRYRIDERGVIQVKGKGEMRTWFLSGRLGDPTVANLPPTGAPRYTIES